MIPGWERCYLVMLATTSIQRRDMIHLPEAAVGDSRHDYRHEIRHEVGLGIYSRIYMRPTRISSSSHISTVRQWNPFLSRACRCVLHVTCILVHPHAPACIHVHSHASTCIRLMPTVSSPDFTFSEKKFSFACFACIACLFLSRASCSYIHQNISACIYVHPRASTRISEGVVLEYSIKSKIALISVTICSFSIRDRHLLNVREKSFKVWYRGSEGIWGLRNSVNRALQSPPTLHIWIFMSSTLLARIVKNAPFVLIFFFK